MPKLSLNVSCSPFRVDDWSSRHTITTDAKQFITSRRLESITLHTVLQGIQTNDCAWLGASVASQNQAGKTDGLKRRELLEDFVFWYFDGFLIPLLKVRSDDYQSLYTYLLRNRQRFTSRNPRRSATVSYTSDTTTGKCSAGRSLTSSARIPSSNSVR
jgi:hypothetical protein